MLLSLFSFFKPLSLITFFRVSLPVIGFLVIKDEVCCLCFKDYGIGIPDDLKFKIFNEGFHYGETGNTGIGVYIVQQTIDDYDGRIFVEDNEPNGAVFVIKLREGVLK